MKLGVLLPHTKLYGGVKRFLELGNIFVEKGHEFYVFTPDGAPPEWFDFKGNVTRFGNLQKDFVDVLWTTTPEYVPMMLASSAKHKIFSAEWPARKRHCRSHNPESSVLLQRHSI